VPSSILLHKTFAVLLGNRQSTAVSSLFIRGSAGTGQLVWQGGGGIVELKNQ